MNIDPLNASKASTAAEEELLAEQAAAWQEAKRDRKEEAIALVNHRLRHPDISYGFRPFSYWVPPDSTLGLALRNVKGRRRREMIRDFYEQGRLDELLPTLAADELSDEDRKRLGAIHPSFMGGEYLPGYRREEVEIVRIELESTTSDVMSLRARLVGRKRVRIEYRLVDEYETEYRLRPHRTIRPLTLEQLVTLLDSVDGDAADDEWLVHGWVLSINECNRACGDGDPEPYRDFTRVSSEFYPELSTHYERLFDRWVEAYGSAEEDDEVV
jgi:hypothetical protein